MQRVALIGFGAIGGLLYQELAAACGGAKVVAIVGRNSSLQRIRACVAEDVRVCVGVSEALLESPTLFIECAGHAALRDFAPGVLAAGVDLLVASVGALADAELETRLTQDARISGASVLIPSGAVGGLDALAAARRAGLDEVEYVSMKPPASWRGTHAQALVDLDGIEKTTVFFNGSAREAAQSFPQNANVAAAVALSGLGFERTRVSLAVDPHARRNRHLVRARGAFGRMEASTESVALPSNPKTSMLAPMSLLRAVEVRSVPLRLV